MYCNDVYLEKNGVEIQRFSWGESMGMVEWVLVGDVLWLGGNFW